VKPLRQANPKAMSAQGVYLAAIRVALGSLSLILLWSTPVFAQEKPSTDQRPLVFTHVAVIDATGAPAQPNMTVVISGNHITALGKTSKVTTPRNARVMDANNKFMIPGLWDMHTHAFIRSRKSFPLYVMYLFIANGLTGVRDMGSAGVRDDFGDFPYVQDLEWRQAIDAGALIGPRLNLSLTIVNGPPVQGYPRTWATVADAAQAREEVIFLKKLGADFIKVYDQLSRDAYYAIADEAKKQGLPFSGHVPILISGSEASDAGQKSLEHDYGVLFGCSTKESQLMAKEEKLYGAGVGRLRGILPLEDVKTLVDSYSDEKAASLFAGFVRNGTYVTPTLVRASVDRVPESDPRVVKYFSPALREFSYPSSAKQLQSEALEAQRLMYQYHVRIVGAMQRAGVKMLVGTDNSFFGSGVHDELEQLVKAGLTPMEALQTATRNAAEYLNKLGSMGTVEKGKLADLVLLDANPLESIENARKISAVVINGRLLDRKALDLLLAQVEAAAHNQ
jgi:imidazolonepropionase-like amidohydrolase